MLARTSSFFRFRLVSIVVFICASLLSACTSSPELIAAARSRVQAARDADARTYAPDHLESAERHLAEAERLGEQKNAEANEHAQKAIAAADRAIEVTELETSLRGLRGELAKTLAEARKENAELRSLLDALQHERDVLKSEAESLASELDAARTLHSEILDARMNENLVLRREKEGLAVTVEEAGALNLRLNGAMAELGEKAAALETRLAELGKELSLAIDERQKSHDERSALSAELDMVRREGESATARQLAEVARLNSELDGAWKAARAESERLVAERDSCAARLTVTIAENAGLDSAIAEFADSIAFVRGMNRKVIEENEKLMGELGEVSSEQVRLKEESGKIVLTFVDRILFQSGSAELEPAGRAVLDKVAGVLKNYPDRLIQVGGHTDTVPIKTVQYPSNWELSTARALSVLRHLLRVEPTLAPSRFVAAGFGEFRPVDVNSTEAGRHENRRVEIVVLRGEF